MDVDMATLLPSSHSKHLSSSPPSSSSSESHAKHILSQGQLTTLNNYMNQRWQTRIKTTMGDDSQWRELIASVLSNLLIVLANTDMKDSVITALSIVPSCNKDELEQRLECGTLWKRKSGLV
jgi:hypothetical protein